MRLSGFAGYRDLGFAATRRLGENSERVRGLYAASLLKLVNPIGHGPNHIARRFAGGVCFCLNDRADLLALFHYSNLFLLRHASFSSCRRSLLVSNEFLATQFPISQTKNAGLPSGLQRRGHIRLTRSRSEKRVINLWVFEGEDHPDDVSVGKPYT